MKNIRWYRFTFEDGHIEICRGMSAQEKRRAEAVHGKLLSKVLE